MRFKIYLSCAKHLCDVGIELKKLGYEYKFVIPICGAEDLFHMAVVDDGRFNFYPWNEKIWNLSGFETNLDDLKQNPKKYKIVEGKL